MLRVILVDPHRLFREALAIVLDAEADLQIVAHAGTLTELDQLLAGDTAVDLAMLAVGLDIAQRRTAIRHLRAARPRLRLLLMIAAMQGTQRTRIIDHGVREILLRSTSLHAVLTAIREGAGGQDMMTAAEIVALVRRRQVQRLRDPQAPQLIGDWPPPEHGARPMGIDQLRDHEAPE